MSVLDITFPGNLAQVATIAILRAIPSAGLVNGSLYAVSTGGIFDWNPTSVLVDDGASVIKPDDLTTLQPGRWLVVGQGVFDSGLRTALATVSGSQLVGFSRQNTGAADRTVDAKLRERVSILDYKLASETDYTNAFQRALLTNKAVFFPAGDYTIAAGTDFGALKTSSGVMVPVVQLIGEGRGRSRILYTGTGSFLKGGTSVPASNGYIQSLILNGLSLIGTGIKGNSLAVTYGEFTTTVNNGFAGCDSTQIAIEWEFDAASTIRNCEIAQFGTAIRTKLGYGYTISENHIRYNNVGLDLRAATTTANIIGNTIERNGIGVGLWIASLIHFEQNAIQGNYAGADVVSYNWNTLVSFVRNYFEASPKVFYHNGDSAGSFTSNNYLFHGNKGLASEIVDNLQFASYVRNRMISFVVGTTNVGRIISEDNTRDDADGLSPFTNYTGAGASNILFKDAPLKAAQIYDPPSLANGASDSVNVTISGAAPGMQARASLSTIQPGVTITAEVTAADTVHVRLFNMSGSTIDIASGTLITTVRKA